MVKLSRFETLDSWRGICAIIVVVFHFISMLPSALETSSFLRNGYLFVDFFFVLSGFVLCHGYRGKITSPRELGRFAVRRFGRVWPLHAAVLAILLVAVVIIGRYPYPDDLALTWNSSKFSVDALLPSLFLFNAMNLQGDVWNGPAWSIGAEFYVYLLFALLLLFSPRRFVPICIALSITALALIAWRAPDFMNSTWDYGLIRCIAGFFAGIVAYHCYERLGRMDVFKATLWELAAVSAVILFIIGAGEGPDDVFALSLAAPLVFGTAVIVFAGEQGLMSLLLRARPFRALGRYSYSIYMVHQPLLIMLCYGVWLAGYHTKTFDTSADWPSLGSPDLLMVDFVLAVIVLSAATYRFIEVPARHGVNALADSAAAAHAARRHLVPFASESGDRAAA
jgi:peptidoglycan/LPS O-acetylase OafA/YrhL